MTTEVPAAPWLRLCVTGGIACGKSLVGANLEARGVAVIEADTVCHGLMRAGTPLFPQIVEAFGRAILAPDGEIDRAVLGRRVFGDAAALASLNALLHPAAERAIEAWVLARREEARLQAAEAIGRGSCKTSAKDGHDEAWPSKNPIKRPVFTLEGRASSRPQEFCKSLSSQQFRSGDDAAIRNQKSKIINSAPGWCGGVAAIIPLLYEAAWEAAWDRVICVSAPIALQQERLRSKGFTEKEAHARLAAQWPVEEKMKRADYVVFNAGTQVCAQQQTVRVMQHIGIHVEKSDGRQTEHE